MFNVLHSSAGAGKTHALVKHYLLLALRGPDPSAYSHILALTFTNKAAAEMRERILQYLEALASRKVLKGAATDVRDGIMADAGITTEEVQRRAKNMLGHMLHHWPQVAVSTIDAFTRRVVMPFARDLRLDHDLRMTTEEEYYRAKAVDLLLEEAGTDAALTELLVSTCEQLLEEERAWRPDRPLLELSKQLNKEDALEHLARLRDMQHAQFIAMHKRLYQRTEAFRHRMRDLGQVALDEIATAGLVVEDLAGGKAGFHSYLRKLAEFDVWQDESRNALKALENDKWHSSKASASATAALERLAPLLRNTINEVEGLRGNAMKDHVIAVAVLRELMATGALNSIDSRLEALKHEEGVAFFSDLTRKVLTIVQDEPASFLYERLGEKYRHFLIDEFQDTSLMQWHALLPLVENALASGGSALLVGDAKQAIYRWRNGEARQFVQLPGIYRKDRLTDGARREALLMGAHVPVERLASNYRSAKGIITFNNEMVERLKRELAEGDRDVYADHGQGLVRADEGYVEVACYGKEEDVETPAPWALMRQAVRDCLADGFRPGDIAVLVRTGKKGREASGHLVAEGWNVVSPDGLALGGDAGNIAVMALLTWLHRPNDEHAAVAAQAMAVLRALGPVMDPFGEVRGPKEVLRAWKAAHPLVATRLPLITLVGRVAASIELDPATDNFLMGLIDEAHAFTKAEGDDLSGFLRYWDRVSKKRPVGSSTGKDAIQVMTIHKAKGLQFPVVIIPEAGATGNSGRNELLWIKPDAVIGGPPSALVQFKRPLSDLCIPEVVEEKRLALLDDLDVLYVALTRPEQRLYISVDAKDNGPFTTAMRQHLDLTGGTVWSDGAREQARLGADPGSVPMELSSGGSGGPRELAVRMEAPAQWDPTEPDPYRSFGQAVHAILARVRTVADLQHAVVAEGRAWGLDAMTASMVEKELHALLSRPELRPFFGEGLLVHTETTLIDAQGHAVRPDRIVHEDGAIRVLDIKTGAPSEHHDGQVRGYCRLLQEIEGRKVEGWLLYVKDGALVKVPQ
jgi:ATP-dependent exoDNAse (exonuclease V) beta subunit